MLVVIFFFKQKTAYEMRISDWSSDVCSSDLIMALPAIQNLPAGVREVKFGETEFFEELVTNFVLAVGAGIMLVFAVLVLLYRRILPPFVNMASLLLAPLGGVLADRKSVV